MLKVEESKGNRVYLKARNLVLEIKSATDLALKQKTLYQFYWKELRLRISDYIRQYAKIMALELPDFKIRSMKTKWGSCATQSGNLWFNIELAKKPMECIEYIVVHEMVNLVERNHNKRFVLLMD